MDFSSFQKQVKSLVPDPHKFHFSHGSGNPQFNIGRISDETKNSTSYFVKLFIHKDVFAIWDYRRHKGLNGGDSLLTVFGDGKSWNGISTSPEEFTPYYHELDFPNSNKWEKVYVIGISHLKDFFEHYEEYMQFNEDDANYPPMLKAKDGLQLPRFLRERYSSERFNRDWRFRNSVLDAYERQCAICRCNILEVLQAAHEHGYEPGNSNTDDPKHGICLCANHHLMYDRFMFDINLRAGTLHVKDERITETKWYREFYNEYDLRLVPRKAVDG